MRQARDRWALKFAAILLVPLLLGATYKWVDPQGQVHFTDSPPPAGTAYEVVAPPHSPSGPSSATLPPHPTRAALKPPRQQLPNHRHATLPRLQWRPPTMPAVSTRCSALEVLAGDWKFTSRGPVTTGPTWTIVIGPAEVARLSVERDANCSDEPEALASQQRRAHELFEALSPCCREAREKLQNLQRPTAHSAPSDIEKQRSYIAAHCPDVSRDGVWLADWIWVRHR
ncbi:MAG: DUF4124 domain-containing protein [Proteobacteria bacterium]|nr:DUF4124 domain-containing protein [Pseudomonadota bacterium]